MDKYVNYNDYYRHYMSLFLEFIDDFQGLAYKGIPLPLFSKFELYINESVRDKVIKPSSNEKLKIKLNEDQQIQERFDHYIKQIRKDVILTGEKEGKVLLYPIALRFPEETIRQFDRNKR